MNSRKLQRINQEDCTHLQRLSRLEQIRQLDKTVYPISSRQDICRTRMSLQQALDFNNFIAPVLISIPPQKQQEISLGTRESLAKQHKDATSVLEVCRIYYHLEEQDAKDRMQEKPKNNRRSPGVPTDSMMATLDQMQQNALDLLDCSKGQDYLLCSYNSSGQHSILGNTISPGSYGGGITHGDFGRKA